MSSFTSPSVLQHIDNHNFKVYKTFNYYSEDGTFKINVPAGYETDLSLIPSIFALFLPLIGKYTKAYVLYQYMYERGLESKKVADNTLKENLLLLGAPKWKIDLLFWTISLKNHNRWTNN